MKDPDYLDELAQKAEAKEHAEYLQRLTAHPGAAGNVLRELAAASSASEYVNSTRPGRPKRQRRRGPVSGKRPGSFGRHMLHVKLAHETSSGREEYLHATKGRRSRRA